MQELLSFISTTAVGHFEYRAVIMIVVGLVFVYLGISKHYEPLLLVPIGFGIVLGNMPGAIGVYIDNSVMNIIYFGVKSGLYPPLIFLGIGAMTDFSTLIANPKLILLGAAAQLGIFATLIAVGIGIPLGLISALKQNTAIDYTAMFEDAVGTGNGDEAVRNEEPISQLQLADDLDAGLAGRGHQRRLPGYSGAPYQEVDAVEQLGPLVAGAQLDAGRREVRRRLLQLAKRLLVARDHPGGHGREHVCRGHARPSQTDDQDAAAPKGLQLVRKSAHLIFNVERPMTAHIAEINQNRTVILGSARPASS